MSKYLEREKITKQMSTRLMEKLLRMCMTTEILLLTNKVTNHQREKYVTRN